MIDLHTHLLPQIDDGAYDAEESIEMIKDSISQGVSTIAATPHCRLRDNEDIEKFIAYREKSWNSLKKEMEKENLDIGDIVLGAEVYLDHDVSTYQDLSKLCLGDTNYIMLEFPHSGYSSIMSEWVYSVTLRGLKPIVAHVERYESYEKIMEDLNGLEVIYQLNASSFLSVCGRKRLAWIMKRKGIFFVSSDMHNMRRRVSTMGKAYKTAGKKWTQTADALFGGIAGEMIKKTSEGSKDLG